MNSDLLQLCEEFIAARDTVSKAFKLQFNEVYPVCANIFLSHGAKADADRIRACRDTIKDKAGLLNSFRGSVYAPCACMLACSEDPGAKMEQASAYYRLLKEYFSSGEPLVLASMLMTDMTTPETARAKAERGRTLYKKMKEKHRFLTDQDDSVFAVLMAFSDKSDDALIAETEEIMTALDGVAGKNYLQTVAQILSMSDKPIDAKCERFKKLFESLRAAGIKYGKGYELAVLAQLSLTDTDVDRLVESIAQVADYLAKQKGYGIFSADKKTRYMHAAMLVSTFESPSSQGNAAAVASMISIVAIEMLIVMIITIHSAQMMASIH